MYTRYIPQSDGSYRRKSEPDKCPPPPQKPQPVFCETAEQKGPLVRKSCPVYEQQESRSFLKNLLPNSLDTGDLLIMVLLLLMSGECAEDRSTALLTLALYLIL